MANLKNTNIDNNLELPQGTTGERPASPEEGQIRYNTDLAVTEFYNGANWRPLSDTHPEATGGTVVDTDIGGVPYRIHYFSETGTDTLTVTNPGEVEYLIVAGGGGGGQGGSGSGGCGGGGAGGLLTGFTSVEAQSYSIDIGAGGSISSNGSDSSALGLTALGGGAGGNGGQNGSNGGSGGGGSQNGGTQGGAALQPGSTDGGFGNNGGDTTGVNTGGGGGGAGAAGGFGDDAVPEQAAGGSGIVSSITGNNNFYAGGGAGGENISGGQGSTILGGLGGGGASIVRGFDATPNTGGGGGGAGSNGASGGAGASGIVIIRYPRNSSLGSQPDETRPSFQPFFYASDVRPIIVRDGLVAELDAANPLSYSGSGTTWQDLGETGNDLNLVNGVSYTPQNFGGLVFDGIDDYAIREVFNQVPFGYYLTISVWIYPTNIGGETRRIVCQARRPQSTNGEYLYGLNSSGTQNYWDYNNNNGGYGFQTNTASNTALQNGNFYNCVFTKQKSIGTFYLNGQFDGNVTATGPAGGEVEFVNNDFVIGNDHRGLEDHFGGNIYHVKIYNRALSETEIQQNFNATRGRYGI